MKIEPASAQPSGTGQSNESSASAKDNPLLRALARWENEGGSVYANEAERAGSIQEEEYILHCLGVAVIRCWNNLSVEVQRELFASASSFSDPLPTVELKEHIARFLHSHKNL